MQEGKRAAPGCRVGGIRGTAAGPSALRMVRTPPAILEMSRLPRPLFPTSRCCVSPSPLADALWGQHGALACFRLLQCSCPRALQRSCNYMPTCAAKLLAHAVAVTLLRIAITLDLEMAAREQTAARPRQAKHLMNPTNIDFTNTCARVTHPPTPTQTHQPTHPPSLPRHMREYHLVRTGEENRIPRSLACETWRGDACARERAGDVQRVHGAKCMKFVCVRAYEWSERGRKRGRVGEWERR